jgi:hypothetical protein
MATQRALARKPSSVDRHPVTATALQRSPSIQRSAASLAPVPSLQERLGNQGVARFVARSVQRQPLEVSSPHDPAEIEATSVAASVMRMPDTAVAARSSVTASPTLVSRCACSPGAPCSCGGAAQRAAAPGGVAAPGAAPVTTTEIQSSLSGGSPLPGSVRSFMEPRFGSDFRGVRVHTDERAARMSAGVNAHAFTVGQHIFFGRNQFQPDTSGGQHLIAHELTHTVQQGGGTPAQVQREEKKSWWESFTDFSEDFVWGVVRRVAPNLEPIIRGGASGVFDWLKAKATSAVEKVFNTVMAPVRAIAGIGDRLSAFFSPMVLSIQAAAAKIAQNDCSPIREAAERLEQMALKVITPIVEWVQPIVAKVKQFLSDLWDTIGAPIWGWIKQFAAFEWQMVMDTVHLIQDVAQWIWDKTATIRAIAAKAWTWLKNKIGIGEGPEGRDGILQWVQHKLEAAWDWLKEKLEPFKKQIMTVAAIVGGVLLAVSPAGPIIAVGAAVAGAVQGLRWIAANWGKGNAIVEARQYLERVLFPHLVSAAQSLAASITRVANSISSSLGSLATGLLHAVGTVAGSILSFAVSAIQWIADQAVKLAAWATGELQHLATWVTSAINRLKEFLNRVMEFLRKAAAVVIDIWGLPLLLGEKVWNWVPACIRDPIVDFIGPIILRQIAIFQELAKDNVAWQKTKADIGNIIKLVFKDHDLMGAVKATFHLVLRVFNVPPELLTTIWAKAVAAWDVVSKAPVAFIKNLVRSIGWGFKLLWDNIWEHLEYGVQGWLFGELADKKINPPSSWTNPKAVFNFVLEVLGLSVDHVFELLAKKFDPIAIAKVRVWFGRIAGVVQWIDKAIDTSKTPAANAKGLIDQAKEFGSDILTGIAEWIAGKVAEELAILAAAAAASGGLSEVLDVIRRVYKAILTAVRWARRVLDMVNQVLDTVLDIAGGAVEKVGAKFEKILHRGMPVVIGFLADQVGLGGVGTAMRDIVDKLREKVDAAILWLIDKIKAGIEAVIGLVKAGVQAITDWWSARKTFHAADDQDHELFFDGAGDNAVMMIKSDKKSVQKFLDEQPDGPEKTTAQSVFEDAKRIIYSPAPKDEKEKERRKDLVNGELAKIAAAFARLAPELPKDTDYPQSTAVEPPGGSGKARKNTVKYIVGDPVAGTAPEQQGEDSDTPGWKRVYKAGLTTQSDKWVQMHVVSEKLGGLGRGNNLISSPNSINTGYFRSWEHAVAQLAGSKDKKIKPVLWVDVAVSWRGGKYGDFAESVSGKAGLYLWKAKKWERNTTPSLMADAAIPKPDFHEEDLLSLNFSSKTDLNRYLGDTTLVRLIAENRPYGSYPQFKSKMKKAAVDTKLGDIDADLTAIVSDKRIVLKDVSE